MAFKCNTAATDAWTSKIGGVYDGTIAIEEEDGEGIFKGKHKKAQEQEMRGRCHTNGIWFLLPAVKPEFLYSGIFITDDEIKGFRIALGAIAAAGDDEWVATRPPTFEGQSERETPSK